MHLFACGRRRGCASSGWMVEIVLLFLAGCLGGGLNAAAGGGSFVGFPSLVLAGLDPVTATRRAPSPSIPARSRA